MFTSNITQYIDNYNNNISPLINIDTLYFEKAYVNKDGSYTVHRHSMAKHLPIGYKVCDISEYDIIKVQKYTPDNTSYESINGSVISVAGNIYRKDVSLMLNNGIKAGTDILYRYNIFNVSCDYVCTINNCIQNYITKFEVSSDLNMLVKNASALIQNASAYIHSQYVTVDKTVSMTNVSIDDISGKVDSLVSKNIILNASISKYMHIRTEDDKCNSIIYTHESLWQLMANNGLVPGNTYNMLYYPTYDVSLNIGNSLIFSVTSDGVTAEIKNENPGNTVNVNASTYEPFPYILKLTAVSNCQFSKYASVCSYGKTIYNYVGNLINTYSYISAIEAVGYREVFQYNDLSIVLTDIAYVYQSNQITHIIGIFYDHKYGYIFIPSSSINYLFLRTFNHAYVINPAYRYSLNIVYKEIYDRLIFKKVNGLCSLSNIKLEYDEYLDIMSFFQTANCIDVINDFGSAGNIPTLQSSIKNFRLLKRNLPYSSIYDSIKNNLWDVTYNYADNEITYMKDEFGNEGYYNFWHKYISVNSVYTGLTYVAGSTFINNTVTLNNINALIDQAVNNNVLLIHNNYLQSPVLMINSSQKEMAGNIVSNSENIILYNTNACTVKNCHNAYIINSQLVKTVNNCIYDSVQSLMAVQVTNAEITNVVANVIHIYYVNGALTFTQSGSYIGECNNIYLQNIQGYMNINTCNNIKIENDANIMNLSNINNITLFKDTYYYFRRTSDTMLFNGNMFAYGYRAI
ncbi:MAG: hypothetical protein [Wendovervirus sonii]|uniref:Tail fiber protein n=1 Tax=phage Lak_Megaphage_Sonny TaxID=3109229 RepID=A0ABZ0Z6I4_9CAUD|nr:MAG: hypothetical protein [phage Lak_Megaphage_Sonny]